MRAAGLMNDTAGDNIKTINGIEYHKGDKVWLRLGKRRTDAIDMLMDNKIATIETIYTDYEDQFHMAVTLDEDPAQEMRRDLGLYLYFKPDEVEKI